jgi:hypothetical protein
MHAALFQLNNNDFTLSLLTMFPILIYKVVSLQELYKFKYMPGLKQFNFKINQD